MTEWTNDTAIQRWGTIPRDALQATAHDGDFAKRHLINPVLLRMLGDLQGQRVLDAGCGNGYLSRILARRGAQIVGVEPGQSQFEFAVEQETSAPQGIQYVQADLCALPDLGAPFDAVVSSMVLPAVPDWTGAMRACVQALKPGGLFVFTVNHPCYEQLWPTWRQHGEYRTARYLAEYEIPGPSGVDFHRTIATYLNQLISLGCHLTELAEPGLTPQLAENGPDGIDAYTHLPNFLIAAARRAA
ncbi:class I SAM-dependent methyltransferase [Dactylosporangium siamense]|uniref:Methyltransferase n=1 Tax=Dactylosporangium siamense TaxID=685454 RepID=A0A919U820_9ACTN|nr:class I SAM-dependent methyltransferase [Dactylosporangium siamense]GIG42310.1 methyltransferase [Dactylosporangium siamense]